MTLGELKRRIEMKLLCQKEIATKHPSITTYCMRDMGHQGECGTEKDGRKK